MSPATINVAAGDTAGLIAAIHTANADGSGDTIVLASGSTYDFSAADNTTNGANALPVITSAGLTIQGNNATIQRDRAIGTPAFRFLDIAVGANVNISNVGFHNGLIQGPVGQVAQGGGIFNSGQLTLTATAVGAQVQGAAGTAAQPAGGDAQGGAIFNAAGATLTVTAGSNISGFAGGGNGAPGVDGARGADATAPSGNGQNGGDGTAGGNGGGAFGGAIYNAGGTLVIDGSSLVGETSSVLGGLGGAGGSGGMGGNGAAGPGMGLPGVYDGPGGAGGNAGKAGAAGVGGSAEGGGIFSSGGSVTITNCLLAGDATGGDGGGGGDGALSGPGGPGLDGAAPGMPSDGAPGGAGGQALGGVLFTNAGTVTIMGANLLNGAGQVSGGFGKSGGVGGSSNTTGGGSLPGDGHGPGNAADALPGAKGGVGGVGGLAAGGFLYNAGADVTITSSALTQCLATAGNGGTGHGGGTSDTPGRTNSTHDGLAAPGGSGGDGGAGGLAIGAGLLEAGGTLTLVNDTIAANTATGGNGNDAGVGGDGGAAGPVGVTPIAGTNGAAGGGGGNGGAGGSAAGGGLAVTGGTVTVVSVTLATNVATVGSGGAGARGGMGGIGSSGATGFANGSPGPNGPAGSAGAKGMDLADGVYVQAGTIQVLDTIIAQNLNSSGGIDVSGTFTSLGHNLVGNGAGSSGFVNGTNGDLVGAPGHAVDPLLGPLQNNGGATLTLALMSGSPALAAGMAATVGGITPPTTDQRGNSRHTPPDIGAFEADRPAAMTMTVLGPSSANPSVYGQSVTFTATVTASGGTPAGTVTFEDGTTALGTGTLNAGGVATFSTSTLSAGAHSITAVYSGNSSFSGSMTASPLMQSVTPAPLTITADNQTTVAGTALPTLTVHYAGFVNGDTAASLSSPPVASTAATAASPAGSYAITVSGAADPNYSITFVPGTLTITPGLPPPPPPSQGGITAQLVTVKVGKKKRLVVRVFFADTGAEKREFPSPFQQPAFKNIQVHVQGSDVVLTAKKGKKTVTQVLPG